MYLQQIAQAFLFYFLMAPALTFVHELGHAAIPLINGEQVEIKVGGYSGPKLELGALSMTYAGPWRPWVGYTAWSGKTDIYRLALGPLTSLLVMILFLYLLKTDSLGEIAFFLRLSAGWLAFAFIFTAFPFQYPSFLIQNPTAKSDGKQIYDLLFSKDEKIK